MTKIDSHLEDRSKLVFNFPGVERPRTLGFMENIKLSESNESNYSEYNPIGRNGSVFVYLGAKSRTFRLTFNLTLPNIMQFTRFPYTKDGSNYDKKAEIRKEYFEIAKKDIAQKANSTQSPVGSAFLPNGKTPADNITDLINSFDLEFLSLLDEYELSEVIRKVGFQNAQGLLASSKGAIRNARTEAIGKIMMWVNLIRSSLLTNTQDPSVGPPLVRLTHGILYQNVPCIVQNYDIEFDERTTYDQRTLLPRELKVTMLLREVRTSYTNFKSGHASRADGIPGWESILGDNATLDPITYNHTVTNNVKEISAKVITQGGQSVGTSTGTDALPPSDTDGSFVISW